MWPQARPRARDPSAKLSPRAPARRERQAARRARTGRVSGARALSHALDPHLGAAILAAMSPFLAYVAWRYRPRVEREITPISMVLFVVAVTMLFLIAVIVARVLVRPVPH